MKKLTPEVKAIRAAGRLLLNKKRRTNGSYAENEYGNRVNPRSHSAQCFCLVGALHRYSPYSELHTTEQNVGGVVRRALGNSYELLPLTIVWDVSSTREQTQIAKKMAAYKGE